MCWIGNYKNLKKTEKDIPVFKILYRYNKTPTTLLSVYQDFPYVLNRKVISRVEVESWINTTVCRISKAIHSYSPELVYIETAFGNRVSIYYLDNILMEERLDVFPTDGPFVRVNGIIPKDSTYAINNKGEYVSDSIILKEIEPLI